MRIPKDYAKGLDDYGERVKALLAQGLSPTEAAKQALRPSEPRTADLVATLNGICARRSPAPIVHRACRAAAARLEAQQKALRIAREALTMWCGDVNCVCFAGRQKGVTALDAALGETDASESNL